VFANTFVIAVVVTVVALVIAFPIAFALTRLPRAWRALVFACVLLPLWISVLVRTFSWMLLLERNGPINRFIVAAGLRDQPLSILFNTTAVLIGMVHVLLPYAVLPIYAALVRIDPALLRASEGLGASPATTFRRCCFPVAHRCRDRGHVHVPAGARLFVTPALLGGAGEHHAVHADRRLRQRSPRLASRCRRIGAAARRGTRGGRRRVPLRSDRSPSRGCIGELRSAPRRRASR
jgi:ABC-type spermidine/putrescine transport system permease subunit I